MTAFRNLALVLSCACLRAADPVRDLAAKLEKGEVKLEFQTGPLGYLPAVLRQLGVSTDSQVLVFSKTSFQAARISPKNPRAIYFNDTVSVGFVPGGDVLEFLSLNPQTGLDYYTLRTKPADLPKFEKQAGACNSCHAPQNHGFPGLMATSVFPDKDGLPLFIGSLFPPIDQRSHFEDRWGGWYVTGTHGAQRHQGNAIVPDLGRRTEFEKEGTQNLVDLSAKVDLSGYLTHSSDIVALLTLEHQVAMTNYLVRLDRTPAGSLDALVNETVAYMLYTGEMQIREPVRGNTTFTQTFAQRGPRDSRGRSLRDFDLNTRLFRYPLSYMIYSDAFDGLRPATRDKVYRRLYDFLTAKSHLSPDTRRAIADIVRETKSALPDFWK